MNEGTEAHQAGAWATFCESNPRFQQVIGKAYQHLVDRLQRVPAEPDDLTSVLFMLLAGICADCDNILTLCRFNKSIGAHQLLRSLYEKLVVATYLNQNPAEVENFLEFNAIHWSKVLTRISNQFGLVMSDESTANLNARTQDAKKKFRQQKCPMCKRIPQLSWTAKDTETLAKEVGLERDYLHCYLEATQLLHCTYYGVTAQLRHDDGRLPATLEAVHKHLIRAIMLHIERFGDDQQSSIGTTAEVFQEWREVWSINNESHMK